MSKMNVEAALGALHKSKTDFVRLFERDEFDVGLYKPDGVDNQGPHTRDELYVVATGSGFFEHVGKIVPIAIGDVLFVAAGDAHRFTDFTHDFSAWVVFIGQRPRPT